MQTVILAGGSVLINCKKNTILATTIAQLPDDDQILACFPLVPPPVFDEDDLNANAIGILGKFFSGTPSNGDTIKFNSTTQVWEFSQLGLSGTVGVTSGGTGLTSIQNNSLLYANSNNNLIAVSVGSSLGVASGILNVLADTSVQKVEVQGNNVLFGTRKRLNFVNGANTTVSVVDDPTNNRVDVTISASSSAGSRWDQLSDPIAGLNLSLGSTTSVFTWGNNTNNNSLFQLKDSNNNTGNGYLLDINTGTSSTINPLRVTVSGTANGVLIDNTGKLAILGSGNIEASTLKGVASNGLTARISSNSFISRSIVSANNLHLTVANGDGVSGNPTLSLGGDVVAGVANDTNIQGTISGNILTLSWSGTLDKNRQNTATVYNNQANTYVAGNKQIFTPNSVNAAINIGSVSGNPSALSNGDFWRDSVSGKIRFYEQGSIYDLLQLTRGNKNLTNNIAVSIFEVDLSNLTSTAMIVNYAVHASDGTNIQVRSGSIRFSAVNKSGTVVQEDYTSTEGVSPSIGTLTIDWQVEPGTNKITIKALASTSLTANTFYVAYSVDNLSDRNITKL